MAILKTEAIVLKTFDYRETSRIATFFSKEYGKVSGILKGIRRDHKKFGSSVDRFSVNEIVYYQYRNSDLHLISQCDLKQFFYHLRQDLKRTLAAHYMLELVNMIMPPEERNSKVYQLMLDFLKTAEENIVDIDQLVHMFQVKILLVSGFRPHLDACLKCSRPITTRARFSIKEGGMICWDCFLPDLDVHTISPGAVASILYIEKNDWNDCFKLKITPGVKKDLKFILNNFLIFHLGKQLRSAKFIHT